MRVSVLGLFVAVAACASSHSEGSRESIEVFYSETMRYSIEDGGAARLIGASDHPVYEFQASWEDYHRIADLLEPLLC